jgi:uncharacterized integral membrane protein
MLRALILFFVLVFVVLFAAINWAVFTALTPISLGFTTVQAPLGLIMLGLVAFLSVLFTVWVIVLQATSLRDARRQTKELQAQRDLADRAEASRIAELRNDLLKRLDENTNSIAAHIAQLEDRIERERLLPPPSSVR